jgi:hypothetical protein
MQKMNTYMTFDGLANSRIDTFVRFQRTFGQQASRCAKASVVCMGLALAANASAQVANPALVQLHFPDLAKAQFLILPQIEQASSESLASPLTLQAGTPLQELIRRGLATNPQLKQVQAQQESLKRSARPPVPTCCPASRPVAQWGRSSRKRLAVRKTSTPTT